MGFLDKVKGAMNAVTGNAARVTVDFPKTCYAGAEIVVKITAVSTGAEVKSQGIFVDVHGLEETHLVHTENGQKHDVRETKTTFEKAFKIAEGFTLAANETKTWEARVQIPQNAQPSYEGVHAKHIWQLRGRVEAFGNDPDSGFATFSVGRRD